MPGIGPRFQQMVVEVHDLDRRLGTITQLLLEQGLTQITVEQPATLRSSNIYTVFAMMAH